MEVKCSTEVLYLHDIWKYWQKTDKIKIKPQWRAIRIKKLTQSLAFMTVCHHNTSKAIELTQLQMIQYC